MSNYHMFGVSGVFSRQKIPPLDTVCSNRRKW